MNNRFRNRRRQTGATLFIALAMLLLVTLLALGAARISQVQQGGVAAMTFAEQAFQRAEGTLRNAEAQLALAPAETLCALAGTVPVMTSARAASDRPRFIDWNAWPTDEPALADYVVTPDGSDDPHPTAYIIESSGFSPDAAAEMFGGIDPHAYGVTGGGAAGCGAGSGRGLSYYRVLARTAGPETAFGNGMPATQVILESTFARRR
jgi:Tfp pilus assembly protein PilX